LRYPGNFYYSLPKILKQQEYNTYAFHAFDSKFWNRTEMYKSIGFDTFFNGDSFVKDDFAGWDGKALSDKSFFAQSLDKIDSGKPFYGFFITLSSHHPFNYFNSYSFDAGEYEDTYIGNYLKAANYADSALGQFIDGLKSKGLYDDALLVIYGDHSAVPKHLASELFKFTNTDYSDLNWTKLQKIPLIRAPRFAALSHSSSTTEPAPSPSTIPVRSSENGRHDAAGPEASSLARTRKPSHAFNMPKVSSASAPPAIIASARPWRIMLAASPIANAEDEQATEKVRLGPPRP
jgi:predicted AlkP superfamily pyrophosphatase or phosphodiesterase